MNPPLNLDVSKTSRVISNVWALLVVLIGVIGIYAAWRDLRDSDRTQGDAILNNFVLAADRYARQEKHFEFTDTRISELERKMTASQSDISIIKNDVGWIRSRMEYQGRRLTTAEEPDSERRRP